MTSDNQNKKDPRGLNASRILLYLDLSGLLDHTDFNELRIFMPGADEPDIRAFHMKDRFRIMD